MRVLLQALVVAVFIAPQAGQLLLPGDLCAETQGCCAPEDACDEGCALCLCCGSRPIPLARAALDEPLLSPPLHSVSASAAAPLSPPPADILHVPRSH